MKNYWNVVVRHKAALTITLLGLVSVVFVSSSTRDFKIAKNLDIFVTLFQQVDLFYVDEKDPEDLINSGIKGMLESLDPYTNYIPESDMEDFRFMTTGEYGGIGALIRKAGNYTIISEPYEGFPAQKVGLHAGDTLIQIDSVSTYNKSVSEVSDLLKGTPNTALEIIIKRGSSDTLKFNFERQKITIPNVPYYAQLENNIGYIRLSNFTRDAGKEVREAFQALKEEGIKSVVLDLRGNPGGLLDESVDIVNIFIPKGEKVVYTHGKAKQWDKEYFTQRNPLDTKIPVAVLVDRGSASASEIVAGSLQDFDRGVIIGERTFGKGLVQTTRQLSYNSQLKITTAKYYIPSGRCIQALDYTHRNEDGSVGYIPDSLISEFTTKNGRTVLDGGGVRPDIEVSSPQTSNITFSLYASNLIFDFASRFYRSNPQIASPSEFAITDTLYADFVNYVSDKEYDYNTQSTEKLNDLIKTSKREGYYKLVKDEMESLRAKLSADKEQDLQQFRPEIEELLKDEIVSRYYYQKGRLEARIQNDPQLNKALEVLGTPARTDSILLGLSDIGSIKLAEASDMQP